MPAEVIAEYPPDRDAGHQACRPARMQDIQGVRTLIWEQGGYQRIGDRLERAVRNGENESTPVEDIIGDCLRLVRHCAEGNQRRQGMERESGNDEPAVAKLVDHQAAKDDTETEPRQA